MGSILYVGLSDDDEGGGKRQSNRKERLRGGGKILSVSFCAPPLLSSVSQSVSRGFKK